MKVKMFNKRLSSLLKEESLQYKKMFHSKRDYYFAYLTNDHQILIMKYIRRLRISEFYFNKYKSSNRLSVYFYVLLFFLYRFLKNRIGNKLNIDVREGSLGKGAIIYHPNVIVNGHSTVGEFCRFHGNNCIGNSGKSQSTPTIGNNVDVGYGSSIIGDVSICDNVTIGAGAIVIHSIREPGVYVGVPARKVEGRNGDN